MKMHHRLVSIIFFLVLISCFTSQNTFIASAEEYYGTPQVSNGGAVSADSPAVSNKKEHPEKQYKDIYEFVDDTYKNETEDYRTKLKKIIKSNEWYSEVGHAVSTNNRDKYLKEIVDKYNNGNLDELDEFITVIIRLASNRPDKILEDAADYASTVGSYTLSGDFLPWVDEPEEGTAAWEYYNKLVGNDARSTFKTVDDMIDYIYGSSSKKMKKLIKTFLKENPSVLNSIKKNGSYKPTTEFLARLSTVEQKGSITTGTTTVVDDINESESLAVGDMYYEESVETAYTSYTEDDVGLIEPYISELLISLGDSLNDLVGTCNGTLDKLVYGRLVYYGTNYYSFELVKGNPYGIVGSNVYILFRNLVIPILILLIFSKFAKAAWNSGNGEQRRIFKDTISRTVVMVLLVFLMPNIIDALIALRDIVLNYISSNLSNNMSSFFGLDPSNDSSLIGFYKSSSTNSKHILDAMLYLGVSFISIFYMVTYISTAVAVMVSFMFFPLIIIFSFTDNKMVDMWFKEMLGNVFVPVLDAVLLLMPLMLKQFIPNGGAKTFLISFIACYSVIPSRSVIRGMLGVGGNMRSELLGFGALMGTMRMLSGMKNRVTGGIKNLWGTHKQNKADREMADMYADLARANGEGDQLTGKFAKLGKLSSTEGNEEQGKLGGLRSIFSRDASDNENSDADREKGVNNETPQQLGNLDSTVPDDEKGGKTNKDEEGITNNANGVQPLEPAKGTPENENGSPDDGEGLNDENIAAAVGNEEGSNSIINDAEKRTPEEQREIDKKNVLKNYVNTDNFENKEFKNCLNFAERAKMHRQRANRNAIKSTLGTVGSVAGGVGMGAVGAAAFGGATMFAGSRVNMIATSTGANLGTAVGSSVGGAAGHGVATYTMRKSRTANTAANYSDAFTFRTAPDRSHLARNLVFDPSKTTVPQRRSDSTYSRPERVYQNYSSSMGPHNNGYTPAFTPPVDLNRIDSIHKYVLPVGKLSEAKFDSFESTCASLGYKNEEEFNAAVMDFSAAFDNPEHPNYEAFNERFEKMNQESAEKLEIKKAQLAEKMETKALEQRMKKEYSRIQSNNKATIISHAIFDRSANANIEYANTCETTAERKFYMDFQSDILEQKVSNPHVFGAVRTQLSPSKRSTPASKPNNQK